MTSEPLEESIAIAVCAREESAHLRRLILKLFLQPAPAGWKTPVLVIVINSAEQETFEIREFIRKATPPGRECSVVFEEKRGIPFARNAALDSAEEHNIDWIAFIDDDCIPNDDWLYQLCVACKLAGSDGAAGAWSIVPADEPSPWIPNNHWGNQTYIAGGKPASDLADLETAYTRSVIFRRSAAIDSRGTRLRFNVNRASRGGSDVEYFNDFVDAGRKLVFARRSRVTETYEGERLSFSWHFRRKVRNSQLIFEREVLASRRSAIWRVHGLANSLVKNLIALLLVLRHRPERDTFRQILGDLVLNFAPVWALVLELIGFRYHSYTDSWKFLR